MSRIYLPLILFLLLILQGVAVDLLPSFLVSGKTFIIAHWVFVVLLFITIYYDHDQSFYAIMNAVVFGLLIDIVYTNVLGVYMFTYALSIYFVYGLKQAINISFYATVFLGVIGIVLVDFSIYIIYAVVDLTDMALSAYLLNRLLPTTLANIIFLIICYPLLKPYFLKWGKENMTKNRSL